MTQVASHRGHDRSEQGRGLLEPRRAGSWGGIARDNRQFIDAVFRIMHTGAPWRDLPPDYGDWSNTHRRLARQGRVGKAFRNSD